MPAFAPGFRMSPFDAGVIVGGAAAAALLWGVDNRLGVGSTFVVLHFFLFCNVARISRRLELIWAGVFLVFVAAHVVFARPGWPIVLAGSGAVTIAVVVVEARKPSYHGVGWRWLNPHLREWWERSPDSPGRREQAT